MKNSSLFKKLFFLLAGFLTTGPAMASSFSLTSPQLNDGSQIADEQIFNGGGCHGGNVSPALQWHNPPEGTKSFAVTVYDLDVPEGGGWWHWIIFNIPANVTGLAKGAGDPEANLAPAEAIQIRNDFGKTGYGGPCPPTGDKPHRYEFAVYALKTTKISNDRKVTATGVAYELQQNMIGKAVLRVTYSR